MATFNSIAESKGYFAMSCDGCGSNNIQETIQGYVCGECGLVLEVERLLYYRPYNKDVVQYATLSSTQIGSKKERYYSPHSHKLKSLNRLHIMKDTTKRVFHNAKVEIKRILESLYKLMVFDYTLYGSFIINREGSITWDIDISILLPN